MSEFRFDCKLWSIVKVNADNEKEAMRMLHDALSCADVNAGAWPNGDPILIQLELDPEYEHDRLLID